MTHAVQRTSETGEAFEGVCLKCGQTGLPLSAMFEPCSHDGQAPDANPADAGHNPPDILERGDGDV